MNLVSMDSYVPDYGHFSKLVKVALELEDCFGKGEHSKQIITMITILYTNFIEKCRVLNVKAIVISLRFLMALKK